MAPTYSPIQSITLASNATSITFSSIPQTFTDLIVRVTARVTSGTADDIKMTFNSYSTGYYSRYFFSAGTSTSMGSQTNQAFIYGGGLPGPTATSNVWGIAEYYMPLYTSFGAKYVSVTGAPEHFNNSSFQWLFTASGYSNNNDATTSITLVGGTSNSFAAGSTFHLYGISNS